MIQLLVLVDLKPDQVCENVSESDQHLRTCFVFLFLSDDDVIVAFPTH